MLKNYVIGDEICGKLHPAEKSMLMTASGRVLTLVNTLEKPFESLRLFEKSEQFKTNGLQLYNGSTITLAPSNSSTGFTYATEYLLDVIKKLPAGVYSVSYTLKETGDLGTGVGKITLQDSLNNMLVNALNTFELTDDIKNKVEKVAFCMVVLNLQYSC